MSSEAQRVVVIEDATGDPSLSAIKLATQGLSLKPGDKLFLLRVLLVTNHLGYMVKLDPDSTFGEGQRLIKKEILQKVDEFINNEQINQILQQFGLAKIGYRIAFRAASSLKSAALEAAKNYQATWVILDRKMKKDEKFLMCRLTCGISRVKSNNIIEELQGPKKPANVRVSPGRKSTERGKSLVTVKYYEMILGSSGEELSPRSLAQGDAEASSSGCNDIKYSLMHFQSEETTEQETTWEHLPSYMYVHEMELGKSFHGSPEKSERQHNNIDKIQVFRNSICSICKNRRPNLGWERDFTYAELQAATEGFNPGSFLAEGRFSCVFRGEMNRTKIAVKQHIGASSQGEKAFKSEVNVLGKARHENLVMLLGSCSEGNHRLLVYEYVCYGSLDQHLSKHSRRTLTWEKRMKIAMGAAKGLNYLHGISIIHRDMRPNNILVTHDYEALLGDFGLAKIRYEDKEMSSETRLVGTVGYLAPEYVEYGEVSTKTDVYSFGVVLLQLITGLKITDKALGGRSLVGWAQPLLKERNYPDLIDQRIVDIHFHQLYWMVRIAEKCLNKDPSKRLSMDQVVIALNDITEGRRVCCLGEFSPAKSE